VWSARISIKRLANSSFQPYYCSIKRLLYIRPEIGFPRILKPIHKFCWNSIWKTFTYLYFLSPFLKAINELQRKSLVILCVYYWVRLFQYCFLTAVNQSYVFTLKISNNLMENINFILRNTNRFAADKNNVTLSLCIKYGHEGVWGEGRGAEEKFHPYLNITWRL
jgi:hypothetical protein